MMDEYIWLGPTCGQLLPLPLHLGWGSMQQGG